MGYNVREPKIKDTKTESIPDPQYSSGGPYFFYEVVVARVPTENGLHFLSDINLSYTAKAGHLRIMPKCPVQQFITVNGLVGEGYCVVPSY